MKKPFWKTKKLTEMSREEWESLCDGCGRCCVYKYEDEKTGKVDYSVVACKFLDLDTCCCRCYEERLVLRPDCVHLAPGARESIRWLPPTCAYRLLFEGRELPAWHPLVTGDPESTRKHGMSVRDRVVSEDAVKSMGDDFEALFSDD